MGASHELIKSYNVGKIIINSYEDNELEKFSCFKIIYKSMPTIGKRTKMQEF